MLSPHYLLSPCAHEAWGTRLSLSFVLLLSVAGWDETKSSEVIRRRREDSMAVLSLVPIETCLKSVFIIKWQEGRAAGDGSLFPRAWPRAGGHVVAVWFVSSCARSCALSAGHSQAPRRKAARSHCLVLTADPEWGGDPILEKGLHACTQGRHVFNAASQRPRQQVKRPGSSWEKGAPSWIQRRGKDRRFPRAQRDCTGLAANWDPHWADRRLAQRLGSALQGQGWQGRHLLVSYQA